MVDGLVEWEGRLVVCGLVFEARLVGSRVRVSMFPAQLCVAQTGRGKRGGGQVLRGDYGTRRDKTRLKPYLWSRFADRLRVSPLIHPRADSFSQPRQFLPVPAFPIMFPFGRQLLR